MSDEPWYHNLSLPTLLRRAQGTYARAMRGALEHAGYDDIPDNGLYIIGGLASADWGVPIGQLVKGLGITKQAAGQLVDTLVTRGYLQRTPDEKDRRQLIVTLTDRGKAAAAIQLEARLMIDGALLDAVGDVALNETRRTLAALIELARVGQNITKEGDSALPEKLNLFQTRSINNAIFQNCAMARSRFDDVNLSAVVFSNVNLERAQFTNVNLSGVSIDDAKIDGMTIHGHDVAELIRRREHAS